MTSVAGFPQAPDACPHCGTVKPASFLVCMPCWRDVPWELWRDYKGASNLHHHHSKRPDVVTLLINARAAVFAHLKQFGSAIL